MFLNFADFYTRNLLKTEVIVTPVGLVYPDVCCVGMGLAGYLTNLMIYTDKNVVMRTG